MESTRKVLVTPIQTTPDDGNTDNIDGGVMDQDGKSSCIDLDAENQVEEILLYPLIIASRR